MTVRFGTSDMNLEALALVLFGEEYFRVRMVFWYGKVYEFRLRYFSEFHGKVFVVYCLWFIV